MNVEHGTLRLGDGLTPTVQRAPGGIAVDLREGWCWSSGGEDPTTVTTPQGTLTVPAGAIALAVVETDGSTFLVVSGEAALAHAGGSRRLPAGALVLTPSGGEPQVDVASADEIAADPLVARNRALGADYPAASGMR